MNNVIPKEIFRAYDIRGVVGSTFTADIVHKIGQAIGTKVKACGKTTVAVGRDGRLSGFELTAALIAGLLETGCDVIDLKSVPTPLVYFAIAHLGISSGVMVTGSHNPPEYNGLKMVIEGDALYDADIQDLYQSILSQQFQKGQGVLREYDIIPDYLTAVTDNITLKRPLKIVIDCGNGVTGIVAPLLYETLGCQVIPLFSEVDGRFPNHHPDPGQPENLQDLIKAVLKHKADIGLAFDGDGDRLGVVDNQGKIIWPDRLLILFAAAMLRVHPGANIIYDVKCTRHVASEMKKAGGSPLIWKTGHSLIKAKMKEVQAKLAGEMSGHIFFKDKWFGFDDALYAGARVLEILAAENTKDAAQLFRDVPESCATPELQLSVPESEKFNIMRNLINIANFEKACVSTIDGLRVDFEDGFGLVRCSNTTANLILRFEGDTESALQRIKDKFKTLLLSIEPNWKLPF